ncbi:UNVERIFIED_CONTAM: hypothetical protein GTU68_053916 [Idotea baltica]|nr:hypothetical protein [Idotea baltica]
MSIAIVIPARYQSSRFPGKPLAPLKGASGVSKPLIQRAWEAATQVSGVSKVVVATEDTRIADAARGFGADVVMTSDQCENGTARCYDALDQLGEPEIVVNLQGDAPLTPPWFVEALIEAMRNGAEVATPVLRCDAETYRNFTEDRKAGRVGGTTAVFVIPYVGHEITDEETVPVFHHVGLYAYTPSALRQYVGWKQGPLETLEGLEQLRFLENGTPVQCVEVEAPGRVFWELNNPVDTPRVEAALAKLGVD